MRMKAATRTHYGPPDVLRISEVERPEPGPGEVLVRVKAATVNRTDCSILRARPFVMRFVTGFLTPSREITGTDFAGDIEAVGEGVTEFKVGDRVWGFDDIGVGSHAGYMTFPVKKAIYKIPRNVPYAHAVCAAEGSHYAYSSITRVRIYPGVRVLVNGASGAIGSAAVQLLRHFRADITAVCDSRNVELMKSLGAHRVIDYTTSDFTRDDAEYDLIFDAVGKSTFGKCKRLLSDSGAYISSELGPNYENLFLPMITKLRGPKRVIFPFPVNTRQSLTLISVLLESGRHQPVIDRTYPLREIADAYRYVLTGQKTGNVIIDCQEA